MGFFAASFESLLVFLAIILLSALSNWIKQRQERKQEQLSDADPDLAERPGRPIPPTPGEVLPRQGRDWEEELRRLFEGDREEKAPPPLPRPVLRPVVIETVEKPPSRPPVVVVAPRVLTPAPSPVSPKALPPEPRTAGPAPGAKSAGLSLAEAAQAFERASHLKNLPVSRVHATHPTAHLRSDNPASVAHRIQTPEVAALLSLLRHPHSARQAILAGIVLGPPKGLEEGPPLGSR